MKYEVDPKDLDFQIYDKCDCWIPPEIVDINILAPINGAIAEYIQFNPVSEMKRTFIAGIKLPNYKIGLILEIVKIKNEFDYRVFIKQGE
jgi:hypothetical protein